MASIIEPSISPIKKIQVEFRKTLLSTNYHTLLQSAGMREGVEDHYKLAYSYDHDEAFRPAMDPTVTERLFLFIENK